MIPTHKQLIIFTISVSLLLLSQISLTSCTTSDKEKDTIVTLYIEKNFDKGDFDNLSSQFEIVDRFQPEFTDSTMFSTPELCVVNAGKAYMTENNGFAVFDFPSGRVDYTFKHVGQGPGEYQSFWYSYFVPATGEWTILDSNIGYGFILQYDAKGTFLKKTTNDSIQSLSPVSSEGWLAFNNTYSLAGGYQKVREKKIYQYDSDWALIHTYDLKERRWGVPATDRMDEVMNYDGTNYVVDRDTVYMVDTKEFRLVPKIALDLGKLSTDWGQIESQEVLREAEQSHIYIAQPIFNTNYIFARYDVRAEETSVLYYDVYDLRTGELVFRHKRPLTGNVSYCSFYEGIPVDIDGETLYGWPVMVADNAFYVMVASDELSKIDETDTVNPIFLKLKIKE